MRIRKNARVLVEDDNEGKKKTSYLVCQLNRSPWDDESFYSQLAEEGWDNSLPLIGSLAHSNLASDSNLSGDSMELSFEKQVVSPPPPVIVSKLGDEGEQIEAKTTSLCGTNEKEELKKRVGDHLAKYLSPPPPQPPLSIPAPPPKKRGRPKKPTQAAAGVGDGSGGGGGGGVGVGSGNNNSYGFYYYSGFGPSWSKKRSSSGNNNKSSINNNKKKNKKNDDLNAKKHENVGKTTSLSTTSHIMSENDDEMEEYNDTKSKLSVVETVYDEQLDYIDDEDDEEEGGGVRVRPRKPIKARSLKSLM